MKKYIALLAAALIFTSLTACSPKIEPEATVSQETAQEATQKTDQETEAPVASEELSFTQVENSFTETYMNYHEKYDILSNLENSKIRTHINQAIEKEINFYKNTNIQMEKALLPVLEDTTIMTYDVLGQPIFSDNSILSYSFTYTSVGKDGISSSLTTYINFDLATGQQILLRDLITVDDLKKVVQGIQEDNENNLDFFDWTDNDTSFYFESADKVIFVLSPFSINSDQLDPVNVSLDDALYDPTKKKLIGASVRHGERLASQESYEVYFSYPILDDSNDLNNAINTEIISHLDAFYDYGISMAITDHLQSRSLSSPEEESPLPTDEGASDANVENSADETETSNYDDYVLPPYWFNTSYKIYTNNEKILSFGIFDYQYTGGAHGMSTGNFYSYDLESGKQIKLEDLFEPKFDYITYINDQIYRKIDSEKAQNAESPYAYYDFKGITDDVKFYIEDNDLVIFFDQYDIAAYAAGTPTFRIPLP